MVFWLAINDGAAEIDHDALPNENLTRIVRKRNVDPSSGTASLETVVSMTKEGSTKNPIIHLLDGGMVLLTWQNQSSGATYARSYNREGMPLSDIDFLLGGEGLNKFSGQPSYTWLGIV